MILGRLMRRSKMNRKITNVDVAEDEVEVNDVEDHELKEEEDDDVENGVVERRRRKMMMLRMIMLRPKTGPTLCANQRNPKGTSIFHKDHFVQKLTGKVPRPRT